MPDDDRDVRWPPPVSPGDLVAGIAPAGPADPELVRRGVGLLERWGLRVRLGKAAFAGDRHGFLAADDAARAADLEAAVADPDVAGIIGLRGGWGCQRLLDRLDWAAVAAHPKPLVGFSDLTALHVAWRQRAGLVSFHGPALSWHEPRLGAHGAASLRAALFGHHDACVTGRPVRGGVASGRLVGGNLTVLAALCGTPWQLDATGAVVLLEDVGEPPYRLDRSLVQLRQAGVLDGAVGLAVGELVACVERRAGVRSATALEVITDHADELGWPVVVDLPLGHGSSQRTVPLGAPVTLDAHHGRLKIHSRPEVDGR